MWDLCWNYIYIYIYMYVCMYSMLCFHSCVVLKALFFNPNDMLICQFHRIWWPSIINDLSICTQSLSHDEMCRLDFYFTFSASAPYFLLWWVVTTVGTWWYSMPYRNYFQRGASVMPMTCYFCVQQLEDSRKWYLYAVNSICNDIYMQKNMMSIFIRVKLHVCH